MQLDLTMNSDYNILYYKCCVGIVIFLIKKLSGWHASGSCQDLDIYMILLQDLRKI